MRVISGTARGLKLLAPEGNNTRPTADRIKEALFNIISQELYNAEFLDVFAGSGAIGIEALSRGSKRATFIENNKESLSILDQNIKKARFEANSEVLKKDALASVDELISSGRKFDIIFLDPPYKTNFLNLILEKIDNSNLLEDDGLIICEQHISEELQKFSKIDTYMIKKYKITKIVFLKHKECEI